MEAVTWLLLLAGCGLIVNGLARVVRGPGSADELNRRQESARRWSAVMIGLFIVIETAPRLAHWSSQTVLIASVLAIVPLGVAVTLLVVATRPKPTRKVSRRH